MAERRVLFLSGHDQAGILTSLSRDEEESAKRCGKGVCRHS